MRSLSLIVPAMILGFGLAPGTGSPPVAAQETPTVAGSWTLNADRSDNAREKYSSAMGGRGASAGAGAMSGAGAAGGGGRSRSGGRGGGRGGGSGSGVDTTAAVQPQPRARGGRGATAAMALLQGPEQLEIVFSDSTVTLNRGAAAPLELKTDGKELRIGYSGAQVIYKAKWNGKKLEIETKLQGGPSAVETYELDKKDPSVMTVDVRFTEPGTNGNTNIHLTRVYDRS